MLPYPALDPLLRAGLASPEIGVWVVWKATGSSVSSGPIPPPSLPL